MRQTLERFNQACNWLAHQAFTHKVTNNIVLQKLYYFELRSQFGLSAQMAAICVRHVASAYKRDKTIQPKFRKHAAMPYDRRILSFKGIDRVSLKTLSGRLIVPMIMGRYQEERFSTTQGQCDLVLRKDGKWFLLATIDIPDATPIPATDFLGVDLGVINLATDSDGQQHKGAKVEAVRQRYADLRQSLQTAASKQKKEGKRPRNIRRKLKKTAQKECRFRRNENHLIAKELVVKAKGSLSGIALEELKGIRDRTKFRKPQRARMHGWSFSQLRQFIEYKAQREGVAVVVVDPRNTSRTCSSCGHCEKGNRKSQSEFVCKVCHFSINADVNAAKNIRSRAVVNQRIASLRQTQAVAL